MLRLLTTDSACNVFGDEVACWTSIDAWQRFNEPGSGQFVAPAHPWLLEQLEAAHRIALVRDGQWWCAGPVEQIQIARSVSGETSGVGRVTATWADDMAWLTTRHVYPNPAAAATSQTVDSHWVFDGNAEAALRALVNLNAGPAALAPRRIPQLVLGDLVGVGGTVKLSIRFDVLTDALRSAAERGGGLGFRVRQNDTDLLFDVYQPRDLSASIRFGFGLQNLRDMTYTRTAPTATAAIVAGQGEGTARAFVERINTAGTTAWGRFEKFVDQRGSSESAELEQAGDEALTEGGEKAELSTVTVDVPDQRYGTHFGLGDRVSVQVWRGREITDVVRAAHLTATPSGGELVAVTVGTQEASADPEWVQRLRRVDRDLRYLQANAET
jgi:hypothetical protein